MGDINGQNHKVEKALAQSWRSTNPKLVCKQILTMITPPNHSKSIYLNKINK
jgi:hypothetical protein